MDLVKPETFVFFLFSIFLTDIQEQFAVFLFRVLAWAAVVLFPAFFSPIKCFQFPLRRRGSALAVAAASFLVDSFQTTFVFDCHQLSTAKFSRSAEASPFLDRGPSLVDGGGFIVWRIKRCCGRIPRKGCRRTGELLSLAAGIKPPSGENLLFFLVNLFSSAGIVYTSEGCGPRGPSC